MTVPEWAIDYIQYWRDILLLQEWQFFTSLTDEPLGDSQNLAGVNVQADYVTARIEIRDDIPVNIEEADALDQYRWKKTIIHELVHVRLYRITCFVQDNIFPELGQSLYGIISRQFKQMVEPTVEILTEILYSLSEAK
jgi:hypothetical protein